MLAALVAISVLGEVVGLIVHYGSMGLVTAHVQHLPSAHS
jgi:hypothetical protein